ncbi:MAG TPA: hypothetical protein EYH47_10060 [Pseudomonas oleovorans]|nr:hypothetical protein [Pseudomonas oleovorans]
MRSLLRTLLLPGLPAFEAPQNANQRRFKALHLANRLAFLGQQALLYCLLDDHMARHHCQACLDELDKCCSRLQALVEGSAEQQLVGTLARLSQSYALMLCASEDDELRHATLVVGELVLLRSLDVAKRLAAGCDSPTAQWLAQCGRVYAYSQRTLCLLALSESMTLRLDRASLVLTCHEHCHHALVELARLAACHTAVNQLLRELEQLHHCSSRVPDAPWLHEISSSLLFSLKRLEDFHV